jgi:hypothetical protein
VARLVDLVEWQPSRLQVTVRADADKAARVRAKFGV